MTSLDTLPASWKITRIRKPHFEMVRLGHKRIHWFSLAELPEQEPLEELIQTLLNRSPKGVVIRGCNDELAEKLCHFNFKKLFIGQEAVLDLHAPHFEKKSLKELVRRGNKKGRVREIQYTTLAQARINKLRWESPHGFKPQLRHLFRLEFEPDDRCFVFEFPDGSWKGAITVSRAAHDKIQTELLVRHRAAPPGIMEALIEHIFMQLKKEGFGCWSLGEVPFTGPANRHWRMKEQIIHRAGRLLNYAYNARGLYQFKNKFNPQWKNVYLCGYPDISFVSLWGLFRKSNFSRLALTAIPGLRRIPVSL